MPAGVSVMQTSGNTSSLHRPCNNLVGLGPNSGLQIVPRVPRLGLQIHSPLPLLLLMMMIYTTELKPTKVEDTAVYGTSSAMGILIIN